MGEEERWLAPPLLFIYAEWPLSDCQTLNKFDKSFLHIHQAVTWVRLAGQLNISYLFFHNSSMSAFISLFLCS